MNVGLALLPIVTILSILVLIFFVAHVGQCVKINRLKRENKYLHKLYEHAESIILKHNLK